MQTLTESSAQAPLESQAPLEIAPGTQDSSVCTRVERVPDHDTGMGKYADLGRTPAQLP
ncbi:MAG: hypothetical protein ACFB20_11595 [Opitutales bacterium]